MVKEEMHLREKALFDLWAKVTGNAAQYHLHHVTYSPVKFEVNTSNVLVQEKKIIWPWPWVSHIRNVNQSLFISYTLARYFIYHLFINGNQLAISAQGSYKQDCVKFKDFSRTSK